MTDPKSVVRHVYQSGQMLVDIPEFVRDQMAKARYAEIIMTTEVPRSAASEPLEHQLRGLHDAYELRAPIEYGCSQTVKRVKNGLFGHLHFEPAEPDDGKELDAAVRTIDGLCAQARGTQGVSIIMNIKYYPKGESNGAA